MEGERRLAGWTALIAILGGALIAVRYATHRWKQPRIMFLVGAVIERNTDPHNELPLAQVMINATNGRAASECRSDAGGFFQLPVPAGSLPGQRITVVFRHRGFRPLVLSSTVSTDIHVVRMDALPHEVRASREVVIADVRVRYSTNATTVVNVGSVAKTFQVVNLGNVPCRGRSPCSPDGRWKAASRSFSLDAGTGNQFSNVRVSCIAGPCPFTRVQPIHYSRGRSALELRALDWSDTVVYLLQAEVVHSEVSDIIRETYPVIFGDALNFTVPSDAEGISVEAEVGGQPIVFPMGPANILDWADCSANMNGDQSRVYRCELDPGYRFQ